MTIGEEDMPPKELSMNRYATYGGLLALLLAAAAFFFFTQSADNPSTVRDAGATPAVVPDRAKSGAPVRHILTFGDSLVAGYGLPAGQSFPAQLEADLNAQGMAVRVHNAGVSGDTTAAALGRLDWVLKGMASKPDLAIVELGGNDMLRGLDPAAARANLEAIIVKMKGQGIPVLLAGMRASPNLGKKYQTAFDGLFADLAKRHNLAFYPFFMDGVAAQMPLLQPDGMHPNEKGVAVITKAIRPTIVAALDKAGKAKTPNGP
jgi:acyl-CoA thioesterase I